MELLLGAALVVVIVLVIALIVLIIGMYKKGIADAKIQASLSSALSDIKNDLQTVSDHGNSVHEGLNKTHQQLDSLRIVLDSRASFEEDSRKNLSRLVSVIVGSSARGAAGENILEEQLGKLPPEMLERNFRIGGKVVEFALKLPGGKVLPIDSKWTAMSSLEQLETITDAPSRTRMLANVERDVEARIKDVAQYIDPATTTTFALAAIPDAAYSSCRGVFAEAYRRKVVIVSYSLCMPYLLTLYQLHLQYSRSLDVENVQEAFMEIERQMTALDDIFENNIQRSATVLQNSYGRGKQVIARIRSVSVSVQPTEFTEEPKLKVLPPDPDQLAE